jgi:hypothetical protein
MTAKRNVIEVGTPEFVEQLLAVADWPNAEGDLVRDVRVEPRFEAREMGTDGGLDPIVFVASTERVARDGDIIETKGWDLAEFRTNPVFLWEHGFSAERGSLPIGKVVDVRAVKADEAPKKIGAHLEATVEFDEEDPFSRAVHGLYRRGFLNAVSVRWRTLAFRVPSEDERKTLGLAAYGIVIQKARLLEISGVTIPADPAALKKRVAEGLADRSLDAQDLAVLRTCRDASVRAYCAEQTDRLRVVDDEGAFRRLVLSRLDELTEAVRRIPQETRDPETGREPERRPEAKEPPTRRNADGPPDYFGPLTHLTTKEKR